MRGEEEEEEEEEGSWWWVMGRECMRKRGNFKRLITVVKCDEVFDLSK